MPGGADPESIRLVLDLDLAGGAPRGRLVDEQGSSVDFAGWLQLMDGLAGVRDRATIAAAAAARGDGARPPAGEA